MSAWMEKCVECGASFDYEVVRDKYDQKYAPRYEYEVSFGDPVCWSCACYYTDRECVERADLFGGYQDTDD